MERSGQKSEPRGHIYRAKNLKRMIFLCRIHVSKDTDCRNRVIAHLRGEPDVLESEVAEHTRAVRAHYITILESTSGILM